ILAQYSTCRAVQAGTPRPLACSPNLAGEAANRGDADMNTVWDRRAVGAPTSRESAHTFADRRSHAYGATPTECADPVARKMDLAGCMEPSSGKSDLRSFVTSSSRPSA